MTTANHRETCGVCHGSDHEHGSCQRITWTDSDGDSVWLRVMYAEASGSGYREATEADLAAAGFIRDKKNWYPVPPCQHPSRQPSGRHETYVDMATGECQCRACGLRWMLGESAAVPAPRRRSKP